MREVIILIAGLSAFFKASSQVDNEKNIYSHLDTIETYNVGLRSETGPSYARYFVNENQVEKRTYDYYQKMWNNFTRCKPCFLKTYDINNILIRGAIQYSDCGVGVSIDYYPSGQIKLIGHYKQNETGDWSEIYKRGYCSVQHGKWIYFDINGKVTKVEDYKDGKLAE